jgi:hypothetical protein
MPPRYSYWTILAGGLPTAFRATEREELLPTFRRLKDKHPDAEMKWFARGRLWDSPEAAQSDLERARERRDRDWRPGGEHRDPRQKFKDAKQARNLSRRKTKFDRKTAATGDTRGPGGERPRGTGPKPHGDSTRRGPYSKPSPDRGSHQGPPRTFKPEGKARSKPSITRPRLDGPGPRRDESRPRLDGPAPRRDESRPRFDKPALRRDESRPRLDGPSPRREDSRPRFDKPGPRRDDARPRLDGPSPRRDDARPRFDKPGPRRDDARPRLDGPNQPRGESRPRLDKPGPRRDESRPRLDGPSPRREDSRPRYDKPAPRRDDARQRPGGASSRRDESRPRLDGPRPRLDAPRPDDKAPGSKGKRRP